MAVGRPDSRTVFWDTVRIISESSIKSKTGRKTGAEVPVILV